MATGSPADDLVTEPRRLLAGAINLVREVAEAGAWEKPRRNSEAGRHDARPGAGGRVVKPHLNPEQELKRRAMSWALRLKINPEALRFEALSDRWGYRSPSGDVAPALGLVDRDERFQDYVIVHELLHLRVRSHGKRFRALLSAYMPIWRVFAPDSARGGCGVDRPDAVGQREHGADSARPDIVRQGNTIPVEEVDGGVRHADGAP